MYSASFDPETFSADIIHNLTTNKIKQVVDWCTKECKNTTVLAIKSVYLSNIFLGSCEKTVKAKTKSSKKQ